MGESSLFCEHLLLEPVKAHTCLMVACFPVLLKPLYGSPDNTSTYFPSRIPLTSDADGSPYWIVPLWSVNRMNLLMLMVNKVLSNSRDILL